MTTCITTARERATAETAAERAERLALRDALARIAKATKRTKGAKTDG